MAVRSVTNIIHGPSYNVFEWAGLLNGDTGEPVMFPMYADKSVTVEGANGATGACAVEGSNTKDGTDWGVLHDPSGTVIALQDNGCRQILESTLRVRPSVSGDGTTNYTVRMLVRATT